MQGAPAERAPTGDAPLVIGRYAIYDAIAAGGMATVHLGRLLGPAGFLRTVAVKRLHAQYAHDADFAAMFLDEARLAARIQHPNVVSTVDVVVNDDELLLVMEYIRGESFSKLLRRARGKGERLPPRVVVAILAGALHGLHAAHEALDEHGRPLGLVHRDVSPQNVLVGTDGVARVLDFGIAKAEGRVYSTREGDIKGKVLYMPPEQLAAEPLTRTADVYAAGVVLFEALTGVRMFAGENERAALSKIITNDVRVPGEVVPELASFDPIVRRATAALPDHRYPTARDMALALEASVAPASAAEVSEWVQRLAADVLDERARIVAEIERSSTRSKPPLAPEGPLAAAVEVPKTPPVAVPAPVAQVAPVAHVAQVAPVAPPPVVAPAPRRSSLTLIGVGVLGALLIGCMAVIVFLLSRGPRPDEAAQPAPVASDLAAVPVTTVPEKKPEAPKKVEREPAEAPSAKAEEHEESAAKAAKPTKPTKPTKAARPSTRSRPRRHSNVNCDPPYVIDEKGHMHFLPECMK